VLIFRTKLIDHIRVFATVATILRVMYDRNYPGVPAVAIHFFFGAFRVRSVVQIFLPVLLLLWLRTLTKEQEEQNAPSEHRKEGRRDVKEKDRLSTCPA